MSYMLRNTAVWTNIDEMNLVKKHESHSHISYNNGKIWAR